MSTITVTLIERFPAHDELGACRASLDSPEQPVKTHSLMTTPYMTITA